MEFVAAVIMLSPQWHIRCNNADQYSCQQYYSALLHLTGTQPYCSLFSAGKCPAAPAAPLPGNFSQIFSQEIFVIIVPAKTEVYHHHKQNQTSLKSIYIVDRKFYL